MRQDPRDPPLIDGTDATNLHTEHIDRDSGDCRFRLTLQVFRDRLFPRVGLIARGLLGGDMLAFECLVRPPASAAPKLFDCLGEQLVAFCDQCVDINDRRLDRPKPATAGLIAQVR